jgi:hypothetical protein
VAAVPGTNRYLGTQYRPTNNNNTMQESWPPFRESKPGRSMNRDVDVTGVYSFFLILWGGTESVGTGATIGLLYKPQMIDEDDCGVIGGMKIGMGNRSTRRKPAPAPRCPPQIPHDQTRARIWAAAVEASD